MGRQGTVPRMGLMSTVYTQPQCAGLCRTSIVPFHFHRTTAIAAMCSRDPLTGLSLRAGGRGFSPATKRLAPGYFYRKIEEK